MMWSMYSRLLLRWVAVAAVVAGLVAVPGVFPGVVEAKTLLAMGMPSDFFRPNEPFGLEVSIAHEGQAVNAQLYVILEAAGTYAYAPSWSATPDSLPVRLREGAQSLTIIPETRFPETDTALSGLVFWAALVSDTSGDIIGGPTRFTWGFRGNPTSYRSLTGSDRPAGPIPGVSGGYLLPSGQEIRVPDVGIDLPANPSEVWLAPDGNTAVVSFSGPNRESLVVVNLMTGRVTQKVNDGGVFNGMVWDAGRSRLLVPGGGQQEIRSYSYARGRLSTGPAWSVDGFPSGLSLAPDGNSAWVTCMMANQVRQVDLRSGDVMSFFSPSGDPVDVVAFPSRNEIHVLGQGKSEYQVFDVRNDEDKARLTLPFPKNPERFVPVGDGRTFLIPCSDADTVVVWDALTRQAVAAPDLRMGVSAYGASPAQVAYDSTRNRAYVALAGENAIAVLDLNTTTVVGHVPTAWYPVGVGIDSLRQRLVVVSSKGVGKLPDNRGNQALMHLVPVPSDAMLASNTSRIEQWNRASASLFRPDPWNYQLPVPLERGFRSTAIEHVILVVREAKSYDSVLGDSGLGDADRNGCVYCGQETRNFRALARRFAVAENFFLPAEDSLIGHAALTMGQANLYTERHWRQPLRDRNMALDLVFFQPAYPLAGSMVERCIASGVPLRIYGQAIGAGRSAALFNPQHTHWGPADPPWWTTQTTDMGRVEERLQEWDSDPNLFPSFASMILPNDIGSDGTSGQPTTLSMVADNDEALGRMVEWLSRSPFWEKTVVFVVPAATAPHSDHVSAFRAPLLVISPHVRNGGISTTRYTVHNLWSTITHLLGMSPGSAQEERSQPMYDLFVAHPDTSKFTHLPRTVPVETNP